MSDRCLPPAFGRGLPLVLALLGAACDIPTEAPQWDTQWTVPADSAHIDVSELLPATVGVTPDGTAFTITVPPVAFSQTLGDMCSACPPAAVAPKPAFQTTFEDVTNLPADVSSVTTRTASADISLTNDFSFDPIRPGGSETGELRLEIRDGDGSGPVVAELTVDGATDSIPPGSTYMATLDLDAKTFGDILTAVVFIASPSGPSVLLTSSDEFSVDVSPSEVLVDEAVVALIDQAVDIDPVSLDAEDIPEEIIERLEGGALVLEVDNPFAVEADLDLQISGPGFAPIQKDVEVGQGASEEMVELTAAELRSFLGQPNVSFEGSGAASAPSGTTAVRADQVLRFRANIQLTVRVGS
ncbi:MAG: hypothetical protein HKO53_04615 [Gemmatimonadetes bacterium]|nr:hypothetical protein [Gemmatimonadota bacterium]